jgi:hypothetical protein
MDTYFRGDMDKFNKNVIDKRSIKLEHIMSPNYIPLGSGRPNRDNVISNDDILNLQIAFGNSNSVEEFIAQVW